MQKIVTIFGLSALVLFFHFSVFAQSPGADSLTESASLEQCVAYAIKNQAAYRQTVMDQDIADHNVKAQLAGWSPQVSTQYYLQHYFQVPYSYLGALTSLAGPGPGGAPADPYRRFGAPNNSYLLFQVDQTLFSGDLLLASKGAKYTRLQAQQNAESAQIALISDVSKAFYDVLLTKKQLNVLEEDVLRQQKLLKDSYNQYMSGVLDKIDYKRTSISLNNTLSQKKGIQESVKYKTTYLKQLMGYPSDRSISLEFDTVAMLQKTSLDTLQPLNYENRIEYRLLKTQKQLNTLNAQYYNYTALPTVTALANYNFAYLNPQFSELYSQNLSNSQVAVRATMPLFQGGRRIQNLKRAKLQTKRVQLGMDYTKSQIQTQYDQSMGVYKTSLNDFNIQNENLKTAKEVYAIVKRQYDQGIKAYLDVITSETDLRNSEMNYLNALYNVLSAKLDVQRSLGTLNTSTY
jgi:outer membrane protein